MLEPSNCFRIGFHDRERATSLDLETTAIMPLAARKAGGHFCVARRECEGRLCHGDWQSIRFGDLIADALKSQHP